VVDLRAEDVDLAVRWVPSDRLPAGAIPLFKDVATPALSPRLLSGQRLRRPADLTRWPLLDLDPRVPGTHRLNWDAWFAHARAGAIASGTRRLVFSFVDQTVQAAVRGQGVALVRSPFLHDAVASGDLVMPFPALRMPVGYQHVLAVDAAAGRRPVVNVFVRWLLEQVRQLPSLEGRDG
jgi:DNA-binding transcriptional LysR family regulator